MSVVNMPRRQKRARSFHGQREVERLARWLNAGRAVTDRAAELEDEETFEKFLAGKLRTNKASLTLARKASVPAANERGRVENFVRVAQTLLTSSRKAWELEHQGADDSPYSAQATWYAEDVEDELHAWWVSTRLELVPAGTKGFRGGDIAFKRREDASFSPEMWWGLAAAIQLIRSQNIHKLRECANCRRWFFASNPFGDRQHQFCGAKDCKPDRSEYMKNYMQKRRKKEKDDEAKAKKSVGFHDRNVSKTRARRRTK